jgi:hypothetical protein
MDEKYEIKGFAHILEQRKPCSTSIEHLQSFDNFDVEFSLSGCVLQITKYSGALAICGSERFACNDSERVIRIVQFDREGAETCITDIEYEKDGSQVAKTARNPSGDVTGRTVEVHEGNRLLSVAAYEASGQLKSRKIFQYAGSALVRSDSKYFDSDGGIGTHWISTYDSNGRVAERVGLKADGTPLGDGKYKYEYDAEGRKSRVSTFTEFGGDEAASGLKIYEYTCDGFQNWIERREFHKFSSDLRWLKTVTTRKLAYYPS